LYYIFDTLQINVQNLLTSPEVSGILFISGREYSFVILAGRWGGTQVPPCKPTPEKNTMNNEGEKI